MKLSVVFWGALQETLDRVSKIKEMVEMKSKPKPKTKAKAKSKE